MEAAREGRPVQHGRAVQKGPGQRGDRNSPDRGAVFGPEPARTVHLDTRDATSCPSGDRHLVAGAAAATDPVQVCRAAVAEQRTGTAREHRCDAPAVRPEHRVADGVHTAMDPVQPPSRCPMVDRTRAQSDRAQLLPGHHAVLELGDTGNRPLTQDWVILIPRSEARMPHPTIVATKVLQR